MLLRICLLSVMILFVNTTLTPSHVFAGSSVYSTSLQEEAMKIPTVNDENLRVELVSNGLEFPTSMAFIGPDDILVLEKEKGTVQRIVYGVPLQEPILDVNVATAHERGLLGIAVAENNHESAQKNAKTVYLYYTESEQDANDECSDTGSCSEENEPLGNRLYRYELVDNKLVNPKLLLDLPATPGPYHNSGALTIGPDNNIYLAIGDVDNLLENKHSNTLAENREERLDGRGGILRITQDGEIVQPSILGDEHPLDMYYAYGIRNSFGIDFDPVTGNLWDTESGPNYGDEINLVEPGFNSGWNRVQGFWEDDEGNMGDAVRSTPEGLVSFGGKGKYSPPELTWINRVAPTALKFLDSERLGNEYKNEIFISDFHGGRIYHFDLERKRTELLLSEPLKDKIVDDLGEIEQHIFGQGFGAITDMEVGPDGYLYILSIYDGKGALFRIVPKTTWLG
jgi:aldose sugar dehydrogenase